MQSGSHPGMDYSSKDYSSHGLLKPGITSARDFSIPWLFQPGITPVKYYSNQG